MLSAREGFFSMIETMYIAASRDAKDIIWIMMFINDLGGVPSVASLDLYFHNVRPLHKITN
jgi:hypothetical protein